jgi:hypothetical protein
MFGKFLKRRAFYQIINLTKSDLTGAVKCLNDKELFDNFKVWAKEMDASGWTELERGAIKGFLVALSSEIIARGLVPSPPKNSQG